MSALPCPVADPFAAADQAYAKISQFLGSEEACQVKHSDLERQLEGMGRELIRKLLQAHLDLRQPGKAVGPVRDAADTPLTPTPAHTRSLESIFGTVEVTRTGYRAEDKPSVHPLDGIDGGHRGHPFGVQPTTAPQPCREALRSLRGSALRGLA